MEELSKKPVCRVIIQTTLVKRHFLFWKKRYPLSFVVDIYEWFGGLVPTVESIGGKPDNVYVFATKIPEENS